MNAWLPAAVLSLGVALTTVGIKPQIAVPLASDLGASVAREYDGWSSRDVEVSEGERRVAGMDDYVLRVYEPHAGSEEAFSIYIGYYRQQTQGHSIHSPKNCLPGGGWEPLVSKRHEIATAAGVIPVNHYLIANGDAQAVVLYWYQGRGRVEANEYHVKWQLLRDQALLGRSDEALVRIVVPVTAGVDAATERAERVARQLVLDVDDALPGRDLRG